MNKDSYLTVSYISLYLNSIYRQHSKWRNCYGQRQRQ
jgi:hypothetical protein